MKQLIELKNQQKQDKYELISMRKKQLEHTRMCEEMLSQKSSLLSFVKKSDEMRKINNNKLQLAKSINDRSNNKIFTME